MRRSRGQTRPRRLGTAPWLRAPSVLLGQPRMAVIVALVAAVLGFVAATPVAFLSSVSSASVGRQVTESCRGEGIDPGLRDPTTSRSYAAFRAHRLAPAFGSETTPLLGSAITTRLTTVDQFGAVGKQETRTAQLVHRTGYQSHLTALEGRGDGIWVPDTLAGPLGISVGDRVRVGDHATSVPVAAIYADLAFTGEIDNWSCAVAAPLGLRRAIAAGAESPPAVFVPDAVIDELAPPPPDHVHPSGIPPEVLERLPPLTPMYHQIECPPPSPHD